MWYGVPENEVDIVFLAPKVANFNGDDDDDDDDDDHMINHINQYQIISF